MDLSRAAGLGLEEVVAIEAVGPREGLRTWVLEVHRMIGRTEELR